MSSLDITRNYVNGEILLEADLDEIKTDLETFVNTNKLQSDNFQTNAVSGSKLINDSVTTSTITANTITEDKINTDAVTTVKILNDAVTTAKLNDAAVTTAKIVDAAVTATKIASAAVTRSLLLAANKVESSTVNTTMTASGAISGLSVSITTSGKPVLIFLTSAGTATGSWSTRYGELSRENITGSSASLYVILQRDGGSIAGWPVIASFEATEIFQGLFSAFGFPASCVKYLDNQAAGTYTYSFILSGFTQTNGYDTARFANIKLVAMELF